MYTDRIVKCDETGRTLYPVCMSDITSKELKNLDIFSDEMRISMRMENIRAIKTNEFRCPNKNERYLSGAKPTAYRARNNLLTKFYIMKLVKTETITTTITYTVE